MKLKLREEKSKIIQLPKIIQLVNGMTPVQRSFHYNTTSNSSFSSPGENYPSQLKQEEEKNPL